MNSVLSRIAGMGQNGAPFGDRTLLTEYFLEGDDKTRQERARDGVALVESLHRFSCTAPKSVDNNFARLGIDDPKLFHAVPVVNTFFIF